MSDSKTLNENKVDTYLEELQLIQGQGAKKIALIGSRHVSFAHQQFILSLCSTSFLPVHNWVIRACG